MASVLLLQVTKCLLSGEGPDSKHLSQWKAGLIKINEKTGGKNDT